MSDTSNASAPLYAPLIPSLAQAYQYDPRRELVRMMMQQGQQAVSRPLYNPGSAVAAALTDAMGGLSGVYLNGQYQDLNKQALSDFQAAQAAGAGTPPSTDPATGQPTPGTPPNPQAVIARLSKSPVWAPLVAQQTMTAAGKMLEPYNLRPGEQRFGPNGPIAANTTPLTDVGKLMAARDALAPNDPNRAVYDAQIAKIGQDNGFAFSRNANGEMIMAPIAHGPADPGYIATKAGATRNAQNQSDLNYRPAIEGGVAAAKAPYQVVTVRPGGAALPATSVLGTNTPPTPGTAAPPTQTYAPPTSSAGTPSNYVGASLLARAAAQANANGKVQANVPPSAALTPQPQVRGQPDSTPTTLTAPMPVNGTASAQGNAASPNGAGGVALEHLAGGGVSIPNPNIVEPLIREDASEVAKDRQLALAGQKDQATLRTITDFLPQVKTGWSADTKLEAARIMKAAGVSDSNISDFLSTDVAAGQILTKKFLENSSTAVRAMGAREPGSVISLFSHSYQNLGTDPRAVALMTNSQWMDRERQNKLAAEKTNFLNESVNNYQSSGRYRGLKGFNEQFAKTDAPEFYLHAAEAMSGVSNGWATVKDPAQQQTIINLIPRGTQYLAPDGQIRVKQ